MGDYRSNSPDLFDRTEIQIVVNVFEVQGFQIGRKALVSPLNMVYYLLL